MKRRILLVDDDDLVRTTLNDLLQAMQFEVLTASDGLNAIELYSEQWEAIDLVLLDVVMPELSGEVVLQRIRSINPDALVLMMSGYQKEADGSRLERLGSAGFLSKPFGLADLRRKLEALTDWSS